MDLTYNDLDHGKEGDIHEEHPKFQRNSGEKGLKHALLLRHENRIEHVELYLFLNQHGWTPSKHTYVKIGKCLKIMEILTGIIWVLGWSVLKNGDISNLDSW